MHRSPRALRARPLRSTVWLVAVLAAIAVAGAEPAGAAPKLRLEPVAEVTDATALAVRPGDPTAYVATQGGRVLALREGQEPTTVLDLTGKTRANGERGLLGFAFAPDGTHLYVHYTAATSGDTVVEEYAFTGGRADPASARVMLSVEQPEPNHNGGQLAFGPDGALYLGLGDGGGFGDTSSGHAPGGNGQSLDTLLGKIVRVDPTPSGTAGYTVPTDNPFRTGGGLPEIYVYGLRNPWRFSFDRKTGDLWIADVGESRFEEVTRLRPDEAPGANLGWNRYEGRERYEEPDVEGTVLPQIVTSHDDGNCSITGGYVYRGRRIRSLRGWYLYTDYCNGSIRAAKIKRDGSVRHKDLGIGLSSVASFGEDANGELYVLSQSDGVFRLTAS